MGKICAVWIPYLLTYEQKRLPIYMVPFPSSVSYHSYLGNVQYLDGNSIVTSPNYPLTTNIDYEIKWIVSVETQRFAKIVFTNVSLSKDCDVIVSENIQRNSGFFIDHSFNNEIFVLETDQSVVSFNARCNQTWLTMKFRAIVTTEETPACLSLGIVRKRNRLERCSKSNMILSTRSYLNIDHTYGNEEFQICAYGHQSIDISFIDFYMPCYSSDRIFEFKSRFAIKDADGEHEFCSGILPPKTYKSKGSEIKLFYRRLDFSGYLNSFGKITERIEGFRIQYKIINHSFQKYTTEISGSESESSACSGLFRKCYTVISEEVSWDIANSKCRTRSEHLVTITSRKEMKYLQYLLRNALYNINQRRGKDNKLQGAHIGLRRFTNKNKKTSFNWVNGNSVTFTAWESGQPSIADCTLTLFEYFNTESLWRTEDCLYNLVDFFVCEKPFLEDGNNTRGIFHSFFSQLFSRQEQMNIDDDFQIYNIFVNSKKFDIFGSYNFLSLM
ncbi:uncharacterized protein LOC132749073 [Ruditapes philippinarum]|uniref:uncharacterized protein LOC132749073 n=1 Tax=Ruditapes philippinarum TaxID=129788 RepID=UPI00295A8527|nr:uncharacterized protein LOC132749073 [Ruditapes philippinarum]